MSESVQPFRRAPLRLERAVRRAARFAFEVELVPLELAPVGRVRTQRARQGDASGRPRRLPRDQPLVYDGDDSPILNDANDWENWPESGASLVSG